MVSGNPNCWCGWIIVQSNNFSFLAVVDNLHKYSRLYVCDTLQEFELAKLILGHVICLQNADFLLHYHPYGQEKVH